jgi:hypothetical protein
MLQTKAAAGALMVPLAAVLLAGCSSPKNQALNIASQKARSIVEQMRSRIDGIFSTEKDPTRAFNYARRNVASPRRENATALLSSGRTSGEAWFDVTVVSHGDAGGGLSAAGITVRLCARLTANLTLTPIRTLAADIACPADLPKEVRGYGTIERNISLRNGGH